MLANQSQLSSWKSRYNTQKSAHVIIVPVLRKTFDKSTPGVKFLSLVMRLSYCLIFVCILLASNCHASTDDLVIKNAERTIDATSQLVKITHRLTLQNGGKSTIKSFDFPIESNAENHLSFFKAQVILISDNDNQCGGTIVIPNWCDCLFTFGSFPLNCDLCLHFIPYYYYFIGSRQKRWGSASDIIQKRKWSTYTQDSIEQWA